MMKQRGVLFDLDGTMFDTGPEFVHIYNEILKERGEPALDYEVLRPVISHGSIAMIPTVFNVKPDSPEYKIIYDEFFKRYYKNIGERSVLFDGIENLVTELEKRNIPWGVVTNRLEAHIAPLLKRYHKLDERAGCLVGADTVGKGKPDPASLLHAAKLMNLSPNDSFYLGDFPSDVQAANAANMKSVAVGWGYRHDVPIEQWNAKYIIHHPSEFLGII
jgi:2-phosphoglycolate phosphatase